MTGLMESFSKCRSRKGLTLLVLCAVSYLIGLSCVTKVTCDVLHSKSSLAMKEPQCFIKLNEWDFFFLFFIYVLVKPCQTIAAACISALDSSEMTD